jgi:hypothetical protein
VEKLKKDLCLLIAAVLLMPVFTECRKDKQAGEKVQMPSAQTLDGSDLNAPITAIEKFDQEPDTRRKLDLPPKINLFQYAEKTPQSALYGFPDARIWGWSKDGKVAYSIERMIDGRGGQKIDFIIFDLIPDSIVFELLMDSFDHDEIDEYDYTGAALYNIFSDEISNALKAHNIIGQRTEFSPLPIRQNNTEYNIGIIDTEHKKDDSGLGFDEVVSKYTVLATAGAKRKVIANLNPVKALTFRVYICCYFLSPFENRTLVIAAEEAFVFEGTELFYRFIGCHLGVGFN